jgi:hypothetical protein
LLNPNGSGSEEIYGFSLKHESLSAILLDHDLAALGDAYVNFLYSLALSRRHRKPVGRKVDSSILASSVRKAGLRVLLPSGTDRHKQADAAEALIGFSWLRSVVPFDEALGILAKEEDMVEAFSVLLRTIVERLKMEKV